MDFNIRFFLLTVFTSVFSASALAITAAELDEMQSSINRLNDRAIQYSNAHATLMSIRDGGVYNSTNGVSLVTIEYWQQFQEALTVLGEVNSAINMTGDEIYQNRVTIRQNLVDVHAKFWLLTEKRNAILDHLFKLEVEIRKVPVFDSDFLGATYSIQIQNLNGYRIALESLLNDFRVQLLSENFEERLSDVVVRFRETTNDIFERESLKVSDLKDELDRISLELQEWSAIQPEITKFSELKNSVVSEEISGYRMTAKFKLGQVNLTYNQLIDWLNASSFSTNTRDQATTQLTDLHSEIVGYMETQEGSQSDQTKVFTLLSNMLYELELPCAQLQSFREIYDCQVVRNFQGIGIAEFLSVDPTLYLEMEKQIRKAYAGPQGVIND